MHRYTPREDFSVLISVTLVHAFSVLISITLVHAFILFFILPFDDYHTAFLTSSLISVTTSQLEDEILQISFNQALNLQ